MRDWYLSSLLLLYVIYPVLMLYVNKYKRGGGDLFTPIISACCQYD